MQNIKHDLRLQDTIAPFGVGAIVDVLGESLIAADTSWWDRSRSPEVVCERLLARLGAGVLRQAPSHAGRVGKDTASIPYWRFPAWRFCERCSRLSKLTSRKRGKWVNKCECNGALVPMRYVAVCMGGSHVQDVPWFMWAHRGHDQGMTEAVRFCRAYKEIKFVRSSKHGEGLASLRISCNGCGRSRSLAELVTTDALLRDGIRCGGRQPWEDGSTVADPCDHHLVASQRGATGNYLAERISALDIPEVPSQADELAARVRNHVYFSKIVEDNGGPQAELVAGWIAQELEIPTSLVMDLASADDAVESPHLDLKDGEWSAFVKKLDAGRDRSGEDFVVDGWQVAPDLVTPSALTERIAAVGQVRRVREVRALRGFRRHSSQADLILADLGPDSRRQPVYPAIELFGEGIFIRFDESRLAEWEALPAVRARAEILIRRRLDSEWAHRLDVPEARYIALHTIAHLLIRRLAFASGYSSAALQERIYANSDRADSTAGLLIYAAAGDAQGTLGGLVRLGEPELLLPLLTAALNDADICSNDPVCIESDRQGSSQLNLSACHGCALISETSCESGNRLLDRQLVLGGSNVPGLLEDVLKQIRMSGATS